MDEKQYMGGFDASKFKKGHVVVVRNPVRKMKAAKIGEDRKEGQGFVSVGAEDVFVSLIWFLFTLTIVKEGWSVVNLLSVDERRKGGRNGGSWLRRGHN